MERTTKKKKSKGLKRRIGIIAVSGLSLVLTICLSVGATMAWFAGSTYASNTMYMGGPVYVEMAGRGAARGTAGDNDGTANWVGGSGNLNITAAARSTGTVKDNENGPARADYGQILLPGQRLMIYSQARVFSTSETSTVNDGWVTSQSSGANTTNTSNGTANYRSKNGRVTTTTTSVLRAKFSINVEFDPSVGINNFTSEPFVYGYPIKSTTYIGQGYKTAYVAETTQTAADQSVYVVYDAAAEAANKYFLSTDAAAHTTGGYADVVGTTGAQAAAQAANDAITGKPYSWYEALNGPAFSTTVTGSGSGATYVYWGRRDSVASTDFIDGSTHGNPLSYTPWTSIDSKGNLGDIKYGNKKSIYKWKYVSAAEYTSANAKWKMGKPFDGTVNSAGTQAAVNSGGTITGSGNGYYGLWVSSNGVYNTDTGNYVESEAFYKARTQAYLNSYRENYADEYERTLVMGYSASLTKLEDSLNESFSDLVNWSSDAILTGDYSRGFTVTDAGVITGDAGTTGFAKAATNASWLYVDPNTPGAQDTNAADSATSKAGWWYLVQGDASNTTEPIKLVSTGANKVATISDVVYRSGGETNVAFTGDDVQNKAHTTQAGTSFQREGSFQSANGYYYSNTITNETPAGTILRDNDPAILKAKLFEISPDTALAGEVIGKNGSTDIIKTVSISFPFVNGSFALPGRELTNNFANAKITFQITFQALQAFFPYARSIDSFTANDSLLGIGKALNIENAVPIFNEAFDYLAYLNIAD